ncbi:HipA domain-containing protein [Pseudomonas citronellolis]|uniref:HipA domain-containing protein n=1 Tax=Pseudomonas citronellolis TaxID=53408 RepID=UPI0023E37D37|nr:HipA domain-containing protein [Pseudomonas citronellolis]MDF3932979.1 HipA domain-containing protein [Pseudomonas citronellolis]
MPRTLTLQAFVNGVWQDAFSMTFQDSANPAESRCSSGYRVEYLADNVDHVGSLAEHSVSVRQRLDLSVEYTRGYPAFIYDVMPSGAAFRSLRKRFASAKPDDVDLGLYLLERCTPSPIGHLRIKESLDFLREGRAMGFDRQEVVRRNSDFLEYAYEQGAAIGGATGAGGEAPKLLLVEDESGQLHADATLNDAEVCKHWFVKFPRNRASQRDRDILRSEFHYYRALGALGLDSIGADAVLEDDGEHQPSLWTSRFDRKIVPGGVERCAVESIYSVCGNTVPGSFMRHEDVLRQLISLWREAGQSAGIFDLTLDYISRDLLNRILGNSDNHGRNMAILRDGGRLRLAPIYDLAPMVLDPEGITRVTKWDHENRGEPDWRAACHTHAGPVEGDELFDALREAAGTFRALPDLLTGLPEEVRRSPSIPLNDLENRLRKWGLA